MALNRIKREIIYFNLHPIDNVGLIQVDENDFFHYYAILLGPILSPYENGIFYLSIHFPTNYPYQPPECRFITPIYHPNIDSTGKISQQFLRDEWNPTITIGKFLLMISAFLMEPNPDYPLVSEIGELYKKNRFEYYIKAHEFAVKYAVAPKYEKLYYLYGEERIDYELNHIDYGENFNITKLKDKNKCKISFIYKNEVLIFDVNYPKNYPTKPPEIILISQLDNIDLKNQINSFISEIQWNNRLFMYDIFKDLYNHLYGIISIKNNGGHYRYLNENELKTKILLDHLLIKHKEIEELKLQLSKGNKTFNKIEKTNEIQITINSNKQSETKSIKNEQKNDIILTNNNFNLTYEDYYNITNKTIGLTNLGNTCYINSCLQILIHCPLFISELLLQKQLTNEKTLFTNHFLYICSQMKNATQKLDISLFINFIANKYKIYKRKRQNDSQEFCRNLLEKMSSELNEIKNKSPYLELANSYSETKKTRYEIFYDYSRKKEKSIITDLFYSILGKTLKCECNKEFYVFQELLDIPLLIPENTDNIDINKLLQNFFKDDTVEKFCDKCKEQKKFNQSNKMARPPEILILSIQRFKDNNAKNECKVTFNEILDINEFIDRDCGYNEESLYSLFGVVNHSGIVDFGHYYSYIKVNNKDWYEFNDDSVKAIESNFDTSKAYILFYIRIH